MRVTLRTGVKFHDGSAFSADDAVFSIQRAMSKTSNFAVYTQGIDRVVKVDDTVPGLLEGRHAGCWTVAVTASGNRAAQRLVEANPDITYTGNPPDILLAIPVLMALGYYPLQISWQAKVVHTLLILMFFGVMVPQQALVHLLILQHLSVVFMPVLYLCFGALFDMMVFVALYAWAASTAPLSATH